MSASSHSLSHENGRDSMESAMGNLRIARSSSPKSEVGSNLSGGTTALVRKADMAYNHIQLSTRPGECKVARDRISVIANYFKITPPPKLQAYAYRVEFLKQDRNGQYEALTKKEKCEPLFWSLYQQRRDIFPRNVLRIVFDGVGMMYSMDPLKINDGDTVVTFDAEFTKFDLPEADRQRRNKRPSPKAQCKLTVVPMINTSDFLSNDEVTKCAIVQLLDLIITQEMRCPLLQDKARFVQEGHSIFRVPESVEEKRSYAKSIGMGEEVWTGLHMAVKANCEDSLYLNASTSGSLFYSPRLNLVEFYSEVVHGYKLKEDMDGRRLTIERRHVDKLSQILKGTRIEINRGPGNIVFKKFDKITDMPASALTFQMDGRTMTVAEYYFRQKDISLEFPHLPCLSFFNKQMKQQTFFPMELCSTTDEPRKFKGRLNDIQLNVFIKALMQRPQEKKDQIQALTAPNGQYLRGGKLLKEWGVGLQEEMVTIDNAPILPYPNMIFRNGLAKVNEISAEYSICESGTANPR
ncbi:hypothetical protein PFISCL1PPCAC_27620, partial [Pristionchus fissidentatus]